MPASSSRTRPTMPLRSNTIRTRWQPRVSWRRDATSSHKRSRNWVGNMTSPPSKMCLLLALCIAALSSSRRFPWSFIRQLPKCLHTFTRSQAHAIGNFCRMALRLHNRWRNEVASRNAHSNHRHPDCYHHPAAQDRPRCTYIVEYFAVRSHLAGFGLLVKSGSVFFVPIDSLDVDVVSALAESRFDTSHFAQRQSRYVRCRRRHSRVWSIRRRWQLRSRYCDLSGLDRYP